MGQRRPHETRKRAAFFALLVVVLVGLAPNTCAEQDRNADGGSLSHRDIVILVDNHIFPNRPFEYDEAILRRNIRAMLEYVRPRRAVAFAVGHDGHAQYPSRFFPAREPSDEYPLLRPSNLDLLRIWREETRRAGTELIVYVSTLRSDALAERRPQYLRVFGNGAAATVIDHNSAYLDEVLLPGLQEIIDRYDPDGFFLDADYWTLHESWNAASVAGFRREYHLPAPTDYGDASYPSFVRYTYDSYRNHYVQALSGFFRRQRRPLNWSINAAFTVRDPSAPPDNLGTVAIDLPFFALGEAYVEALFAQRLERESEIVYPLFAQSEGSYAYQYKSADQIRQELAVAVANRSLISFYLPLGPDGTISPAVLEPAIHAYDELALGIGIDSRDPSERVVTNVAIVDDNADAVLRRQFGRLKAASLSLFGRGVVHAIITDSAARESPYTHLIFPDMLHVDDRTLIPSLRRSGRRVLWGLDRRRADAGALAVLGELQGLRRRGVESCAECVVYQGASGEGEVWVVPDVTAPSVLNAFLSGLQQAVNFDDKPDYVYALAYGNSGRRRLTIFLSSAAWGGTALGRHTLFDSLDSVGPITVRLSEARSCVQYTLGQDAQRFPRATQIVTHPFDTITKLVCDL